MGKKGEYPSKSQSQLFQTLEDFTNKDNWNKFFSIRGSQDSFEWYAEWNDLREPIVSLLNGAPSAGASSTPKILVPACGSSRLSEHLYDSGFHDITNIDFSKVAISNMLRSNVKERPCMKWRVMDMTSLQFGDEAFGVVLDKGGFDALMEPDKGPMLGNQYLSEVRRVLISGGIFICITLAESHVLELLFSKFRFGWKMTVHFISHKSSRQPSFHTFMIVSVKEFSSDIELITLSLGDFCLDYREDQALALHGVLENENQIRVKYSKSCDVFYSLEDLQQGARGDLRQLNFGSRFQLILSGPACSSSFKAVLLDAKEHYGPFSYKCAVFIVPKLNAHEWLFSSEEGQWLVVESSKAARLIMVLLDSSHANCSMDDIQKDLSSLVKQLAPENDDIAALIPFLMASDGIKQRTVVSQVLSSKTGLVIVEDVVYENAPCDLVNYIPKSDLMFRRLIFQRNEGIVQSEGLLIEESSHNDTIAEVRKKSSRSLKSMKNGNQTHNSGLCNWLKVDHSFLVSSYHIGIISGLLLISSHLESMVSMGKTIKAVIVGLGAGLLPMFLSGCMPFLDIEVVELDQLVLNVAKDFFDFAEGEHLKVHIADGIKFVEELKNCVGVVRLPAICELDNHYFRTDSSATEGPGVDLLIIDVDSSDSTSGMSCPASNFVEVSFLLTARNALSDRGIFVINLVSRSQAMKQVVVSSLKKVFDHVLCLHLEKEVNIILFCLCSLHCVEEDGFPQATKRLGNLLKCKHAKIGRIIVDATKKITRLK